MRRCIYIVVVLVAMAVAGPNAKAANKKPTPAETIRIAGPRSLEPVITSVAGELGAWSTGASSHYFRVESPTSSAGALIGGRELLFSCGQITKKQLQSTAAKWDELAAEEHLLGARAVAIIVHESSELDALSAAQLVTIFSGKAKDWTLYGGARKKIRRYGLPATDTTGQLFYRRVLTNSRCRQLLRRPTSQDVIKAVARDPSAIGFVDASTASTSSAGIRLLSIRADAAGHTLAEATPPAVIALNAETLRDGTYPLSQMIVMYVSPTASDAACALAEHITGGKADDALRQAGILPLLKTSTLASSAVFQQLYGADIQRVNATAEPEDDLELATKMLKTARTIELDDATMVVLCQAVYTLGMPCGELGESIARQALSQLDHAVPTRGFDTAILLAKLAEHSYTRTKATGSLTEAMTVYHRAAKLATADARYAEACDALTRAIALAKQTQAASLAKMNAELPSYTARVAATKKLATLTRKHKRDTSDTTIRRALLLTALMELADVPTAADHGRVSPDATIRTMLPLAIHPVAGLKPDTALALAEWYLSLADQAKPGGFELLQHKATACYQQFFKTHKSRSDALAIRAKLGLAKLGNTPAKYIDPTPTPGQKDTKKSRR